MRKAESAAPETESPPIKKSESIAVVLFDFIRFRLRGKFPSASWMDFRVPRWGCRALQPQVSAGTKRHPQHSGRNSS
ncbi:MAG: hypothetical protein MJZ49_08250 [Bacteroidales bacterium]|nr:hypothetical protein [Bacteroidales bacterium]